MKKLFTTFGVLVGILLGVAFSVNAATSVFNSNQVGTSTPTSGFVLQSLGNNTPAQWVATSSLGITGGGGSGTVNSGTLGQASYYATTGTAVSGTSTLFFKNQQVGIGTTSPIGILTVENNGIDMSVGSAGCISGFLYINFSSSPSCSNYSFLGDGSNTYLNGVSNVHLNISNNAVADITTSGSFGEILLQDGGGNLIVNQAGDFYLDNSANAPIRVRPGGQNESATFSAGGNFGVQNTNPTFTVDIGSKGGVDPFRVASSTGVMVTEILKTGLHVEAGILPTTSTSTGIGTGASTATVTGSTNKLHLIVNTGTSPAGSNALITTITLPQACPTATIPVISDANANSDLLGITALVFASSTSASAFGVYSGSAGLTGATAYMWNIDVGCY